MTGIQHGSEARKTFGLAAEARAAAYLEAEGYTVIDRNWRIRGGELDIVARQHEWLVFVEVRARRGDAFGTPEESVTAQKQARLVALAEAYLQQCGWEGPWRIDVLAMRYRHDGALISLNHLVDAIGGAA